MTLTLIDELGAFVLGPLAIKPSVKQACDVCLVTAHDGQVLKEKRKRRRTNETV